MAWTIWSTLPPSRPSLTLGTHSTMVCMKRIYHRTGSLGGLVLSPRVALDSSPRVALDSDLRNRTYKALHLGDYTSTGPTGTGTRDPAARAAAGRGPESRTSSGVFAAAIADAGLRQ